MYKRTMKRKRFTPLPTSLVSPRQMVNDIPYMARYRFGIAPYIANYDEFQIWVVGQVEYMPTIDDTIMVLPMLRYFYRTVLWETGVSLDGTFVPNDGTFLKQRNEMLLGLWLSLNMAFAETTSDIEVLVKGMVCSFCVQGVEKKIAWVKTLWKKSR